MTDDHRTPRLILKVKFESSLPAEELTRRYRERMPLFRALDGLIQKYYFRDPATGKWGGVYVWDSPEALESYKESDLRATIAEAYEVVGTPEIEVLQVLDVLRAAGPDSPEASS